MRQKKIWEAAWFPNAIAICTGVVLFIILSKFSSIWTWFQNFLGYFQPVILGGVIAYILNPLARLFKRLLVRIDNQDLRKILANSLAFLVLILAMTFTVLILIPQLIQSIENFLVNFNNYVDSINLMLNAWGVSGETLNLSSVIDSSENVLSSVSAIIVDNIGSIVSVSANFGKNFFSWFIAFILSIYLLFEKDHLKLGLKRLLKALFEQEQYREISFFLNRSHQICNRYVVYNLIDSLIIGLINTVFMSIVGMQYVGLLSLIMAVTNLVPTFGPMVGLIVSGFILLMVNPWHTLFFVLFTMILQTCDAYVIKPRLFGTSLGVSGLWILIGVIVGGNMFGIIGILLAIPFVAIVDFVYKHYVISYLEGHYHNE